MRRRERQIGAAVAVRTRYKLIAGQVPRDIERQRAAAGFVDHELRAVDGRRCDAGNIGEIDGVAGVEPGDLAVERGWIAQRQPPKQCFEFARLACR